MGPPATQRRNVVLVGMRASGKTTIGRRLAARLGRPFADLDDELARRAGRSVDELLREEGEPAFRRREAEVLGWAAALEGHVIATGGGAVLHEQAFAALAACSVVVHLDVPLDALVRRARRRPRPALTPAPPDEEVALLWRERAPLYRRWADLSVEVGDEDPILTLLPLLAPPPEDDRGPTQPV